MFAAWMSVVAIVVSMALGGLGIWIAMRQSRSADRSAVAAEDAASAADRSATASEAAAKAADVSAKEAQRVASIEANREHDKYREELPYEMKTEVLTAPHGGQWLRGTLTFRRFYRAKAIGITDSGGKRQLGLELVIKPNVPYSFHIDDVQPDGSTAVTEVLLNAWPPHRTDGGEQWTCPCERPIDYDAHGHWQQNFPITTPQTHTVFAVWR
jgi:hypothetical protein